VSNLLGFFCYRAQTVQCSATNSVVADVFQITFRAKIYANNVFSFLKNHF